ncbi:hypothetical protein F5B18DRAFT_607490 [Nemania serpens]|nr:hypothetical protein F5B18DRAFT_607490 [Nemania serpens]
MRFDKNSGLQLFAKVISVLTHGGKDDDATVSAGFNSRCFNIHMSPTFLQNSPATTTLYLKYLQAIHRFWTWGIRRHSRDRRVKMDYCFIQPSFRSAGPGIITVIRS